MFSRTRTVFGATLRGFRAAMSKPLSLTIRQRALKLAPVVVLGAVALQVKESSAAAENDDTDDSDDEVPEEEEAPPKKPERQYKSAPRPEEPYHKGLAVLVADDIDDKVYANPKDVLVDVWASWCDVCALLYPVVGQVAYALKDADTIDVFSMEGETNFKPGFLTPKQENGYPTLKIFSGKDKNQTAEFRRRPTAEEIIKWLHENASYKFDLDHALQRAKEYEPQTKEALKTVFTASVNEAMQPDIVAKRSDPCGQDYVALGVAFMQAKYGVSSLDSFYDQGDAYRKCQKDNRDKMVKFYTKLQSTAEATLKEIANAAATDASKDSAAVPAPSTSTKSD